MLFVKILFWPSGYGYDLILVYYTGDVAYGLGKGFGVFLCERSSSPMGEYFLSIMPPSESVNISSGSPSLILNVLLISFGITTLPRSSILLTMPVAFILSLSFPKLHFLCVVIICGERNIIQEKNKHFFSK